MRIQLQAIYIKITKALQSHVELRLGFSFNRFAGQINSITVHLSNSAEHHSKPDKCCRIDVNLRRRIRVQVSDPSILAAIDRAAVRAARSVAKVIDQDGDRSNSPSKGSSSEKPRSGTKGVLGEGKKSS